MLYLLILFLWMNGLQAPRTKAVLQLYQIQMQGQDRVANWLDRLQLQKFQLRQYKNLDQYEHRALGYSNRTASKVLELTYSVSFNYDLLVTHLELDILSTQTFSQLFQIGQIQASCLTNRGLYIPVIRQCTVKKSDQLKNKIVPAICITQSLKVSLLIKKDLMACLSEQLNLKRQRSKTVTEQNVLKIVTYTLKGINICGYHLSMNTSASQLIPLLNISQAFKFSKRDDEAAETDILVSLSLISARRFVQASQLLRKVSRFYVDKYISSKSSMDFSRIDRSWIREEMKQPSEMSGLTRSFTAGRVLEGGRYLYKAAKIELLLAQTINQPSLLGEKLQAYNRANAFANGNCNPEKIDIRVDYEELAYGIGPNIMPFLMKALGDKSQILNVSSLKSIEFFFEMLGCTLGGFMPQILNTLISIYPSRKQELGSPKIQQSSGYKSVPVTTRSKLLLDHMNHLLQSLLSLLAGMNKKYLKMIFEEIILVSLSQEYRNELRLYILRFGEKILQICGPDLQLSITYIKHVFAICEGKYSHNLQQNSKHISHNLTFFGQKVLDLLKAKILKNYSKVATLNAICNWIHETLVYLCENQIISYNSQLNHILDLIIAIYPNTKLLLPSPLEPIIYLLNTSLYQPKMPFDKILQALIILVKKESECGLGNEIVQRIMARSKMGTLNLKQLKILQKVIQVLKTVNVIWLQQFLACIPHSNFDQIYTIFDMLVVKCVKQMDKRLIYLIINTLFNQYTVKGKAHQQSKELFITNLIKHQQLSLQLLLEICLLDNMEPKITFYQSRKAVRGGHCSDTKLYKLDSELFVEKINLLLLIFSKTQTILTKFGNCFTIATLMKIYLTCKQLLLNSNNFKIKLKILIFIKQLVFLTNQLSDKQQCSNIITFFVKVIVAIMNQFVTLHKDSKLHYYTILSIGLALQQLSLRATGHHPNDEKCRFDFMDQPITQQFTVPLDMGGYVPSLIINEVIKLWPNLSMLLNSPWQNVREILMLVLLQSLKNGFFQVKPNLKSRMKDMLKPLLTNFLQSNDHTERLIGVKLVALLLGAGREWTEKGQLSKEITQNWMYLRPFVYSVIRLEDDWNEEVADCSRMVTSICLSGSDRQLLVKRFKADKKISSNVMDSSLFTLNLQEDIGFNKKEHSVTCFDNLEQILKIDDDFLLEQFTPPPLTEQASNLMTHFRASILNIDYFSMNHMQERDSFAQQDDNYFDPNDDKHSDKENDIKSRSDEEQLEFQDLGIIELDDEEWGEEESQMKITQKLPLKKVYKLSPNLGSSSKHHRIRNKRYHNSDFQEDKIIIDELQGKIHSPPIPQPLLVETKLPPPLEQPQSNGNENEKEQASKNTLLQEAPTVQGKSSGKKQKKTTKKRKGSTLK